MRSMQIESVLQIKNWSEPAKNRFSVALIQAVNNKGADHTVRMHRLICAFVVRIWHKQVFS